MATFHIKQQSGFIQNADVIHNHGGLPGDLTQTLTQLIEELRGHTTDNDDRAAQAAAELVGALEEASSPTASPGRIRAGLTKAAELLAGVAATAGIVGSLEAIVAALPLG
ncbi:hypothetical protein [Streptomyces himalayensis]|uniref:Uncharacterized protein n=1 Tax=Streptomyces himalayensis subsp. himalayensis TaxID=2756131 RepID=A0A7W0DQ98_9ACTN|nr:hypothetical protein [Streptomyces himalayensis]MBA2949283.1 hypothetical protein [Streptomyces himalayensis subsp. himalayensis]